MVYIRPDERYPLSWNRMRHFRFEQVNHICQECGYYAKGNLHLHHIIPVGRGGKHNYDNLKVVCSECHKKIHHIR